jgi:non-specific serine/threonine protein kinase
MRRGEPGAVAVAHQAIELAEALGPEAARPLAHAHFLLALAALADDAPEQARAHLARSVEVAQASGERYWEAHARLLQGVLAARGGDVAAAGAAFEQSLALYRAVSHLWGTARALGYRAALDARLRRLDRARELARESLLTYQAMGSVWIDAEPFAALAAALLATGQAEAAARLLGFAAEHDVSDRLDRLLARAGEDAGRQPAPVEAARALLGDVAFEAAWQAGRGLSAAQATAYALEVAAEPPRPVGPPGPGKLSDREREVAALIARGLTSREIAAALVIGESTADKHAEHIRTKLGLRSRAEIAAWATAAGLGGT